MQKASAVMNASGKPAHPKKKGCGRIAATLWLFLVDLRGFEPLAS